MKKERAKQAWSYRFQKGKMMERKVREQKQSCKVERKKPDFGGCLICLLLLRTRGNFVFAYFVAGGL